MRVVGIFGYPIKHSLSPVMHNAAFKALKLDFIYLPFAVRPEDLGIAIESIKVLGLKGVNITVQHKEKVIKYLDELDSSAEEVGAVNTIVNQNGKLRGNHLKRLRPEGFSPKGNHLVGYNTDGIGFLRSLENKINLKNKNVLLLGCGGAGKTIAYMLVKRKIKKLVIIEKIVSKAKEIAKNLSRTAKSVEIPFFSSDTKDTKNLSNIIKDVDLVVNATPLGMHPGDPLPIKIENLVYRDTRSLFVYDIVYNRETELLKEAKKIGAKTIGGLEMLIYQGAEAFRIWTGRKAPIEIMRKAVVKVSRKI